MIDTRAAGQELQDQLLAAARKGHRRVTNTVKNVTATAQMIQPQLPSMPTIKLPYAEQLTQLREKQLTQLALLREKAPGLIARLPSGDDLMAGAHDVAGQVRSVRRQVVSQLRTVATPLAHQAAAAFGQVTASAPKTSPAGAVTHNGTASAAKVKPAAENGKAASATTAHRAEPARTSGKATPAEKKTGPARPASRRTASAPKKAKPTTK